MPYRNVPKPQWAENAHAAITRSFFTFRFVLLEVQRRHAVSYSLLLICILIQRPFLV